MVTNGNNWITQTPEMKTLAGTIIGGEADVFSSFFTAVYRLYL
jgi:hypothetical protein